MECFERVVPFVRHYFSDSVGELTQLRNILRNMMKSVGEWVSFVSLHQHCCLDCCSPWRRVCTFHIGVAVDNRFGEEVWDLVELKGVSDPVVWD